MTKIGVIIDIEPDIYNSVVNVLTAIDSTTNQTLLCWYRIAESVFA